MRLALLALLLVVLSTGADARIHRDRAEVRAFMVRLLDPDEAATRNLRIRSDGGADQVRAVTIINESGPYSAILKPHARGKAIQEVGHKRSAAEASATPVASAPSIQRGGSTASTSFPSANSAMAGHMTRMLDPDEVGAPRRTAPT